VAWFLIVLKNGKVHKQMRTFGATRRELLRLRECLLSEGCNHLAMKSKHFHRRFIDLEIVPGLRRSPYRLVNRQLPLRDALDPLHHLYPVNLHTVPFSKRLLQARFG
jgi:hypothetical protein